MAMTAQIEGFPAASGPILGEVINWECQGASIGFEALRDALRESGLGEHHARAMLPRNAFARAARKLADQRIIGRIEEDEVRVRFQFTAERRDGDGLAYDREAVLSLDKGTGFIEGDDPELVRRARDAFDEQLGKRGAGDLTALVKRLFNDRRKADLDLIPMSSYSNFYFVRASRLAFVAQVEDLVTRVGGRMLRLPIAAGTEQGDRGVTDAVASKMAALVAEYRQSIDELDVSTPGRTLEAAAERVKVLRYKLESYGVYLDDRRDELKASLSEATQALRAKLGAIVLARTEAVADFVPAGGTGVAS